MVAGEIPARPSQVAHETPSGSPLSASRGLPARSPIRQAGELVPGLRGARSPLPFAAGVILGVPAGYALAASVAAVIS
jgi:hypothetical protein